MPLSSTAIKAVPTSYTVTGGTVITLGAQLDFDAALLYASADTDYRTRREMKFSFKMPKVSAGAPNGYTQQRSNFTLKCPKVLTNSKIVNNGGDVSLHWDVETTEAEKTAILDWFAQAFVDANVRAALIAGNPTA